MAYSAPPRWVHGDTNVSAARINVIGDDVIYLNSVLGEAYTYATVSRQSEAVFYTIHQHRWLWFGSDGLIEDLAGVGDDVVLNEADGTFTSYDLDTIEWLSYGQLYKISGVSWCQEAPTFQEVEAIYIVNEDGDRVVTEEGKFVVLVP